MKHKFLAMLLFALVTTISSSAKADFFVAVKDAAIQDYLPGTNGTLEVWGGSNEPGNILVDGWTLGFKLSTPSVWSSYTISTPVLLGANLLTDSGNALLTPGNFEVLSRTSGGTPVTFVPGVAQKLFEINFTVAGTAVVADNYTLSFLPGAVYNVNGGPATQNANAVTFDGGIYRKADDNLLGFDAPLSPFSTTGFTGRFDVITAVPEPSSLALVGLVGFGMGLYRRRR